MNEIKKPGLSLTRREGESIAIGDEIKITIVEIRGRYVKVNIDAPKEKYPISRINNYVPPKN